MFADIHRWWRYPVIELEVLWIAGYFPIDINLTVDDLQGVARKTDAPFDKIFPSINRTVYDPPECALVIPNPFPTNFLDQSIIADVTLENAGYGVSIWKIENDDIIVLNFSPPRETMVGELDFADVGRYVFGQW